MKTLLRALLFAVANCLVAQQGHAQALDPTFAAIDIQQSGTVRNALQQPDGKYLVGGSFTQVNGSPAVGLARLNADGSLDQAFTSTAACQSSIEKIRLLANGQILLQNFGSIRVGGRTFNTFAKLNADGSVANDFSVGSGPSATSGGAQILAVAVQADGKILTSGNFSRFNGVNTNNLVRLNADGSVDQAFVAALGAGFVRPNSNTTSVRGVVVQPDGKILVCGDFQNFNNTSRNGLVRLNAAGTLDTGFNPASIISALALALDPRTNYVLVYGTTSSNRQIVRLNTAGELDNSFALADSPRCTSFSSTNSEEFAVDANGRVLLSGCFANFGGTSGDTYVTRFLANGQRDAQFAIRRQLDGRAYCVKPLANGDVLLGGAFGRYGTIRNVNLVRLDNTAQALNTLRPAIMQPGYVQAIVQQADRKLLIAGRFWQINGQAAGNLARLNPDGTLDSSFQLTGADGQVLEVAVQPDGRIVVAGQFVTAGNQTSPIVARLLANGAADASFRAPSIVSLQYTQYSYVRALALQADGSVLVGGSRIDIGGYNSTLHRLLPNGAIDAGYANRVGEGVLGSDVVSLAALPDGKHYVSGYSGSNVSAPALVRLNADGSRDNTFNGISNTPNSIVYVNKLLLLPNNQLLVGGLFPSYNGTPYTNLVRLNADGTVDTGYMTPTFGGSSITMLARYANGRVLVGGRYNITANGINRGPLVRLNPDGSYDASFSNAFATSSDLDALAIQSDESFVVSGYFTSVSGQPWVNPLARLTAPNVLAVSSRQSTARTDAWPNPAHGQLNLSLDAAAKPQKLVLFDALGKTVLSQAVTKAEVSLPLHTVSAGVYLLRVDYADGPVTRRVVVE